MTLQEELTRIWQERRPTVIFITHDVAEAVFLANRVVVLSKGRVLDHVRSICRGRGCGIIWIQDEESSSNFSVQVLQMVRSHVDLRQVLVRLSLLSRSGLGFSCRTDRARQGVGAGTSESLTCRSSCPNASTLSHFRNMDGSPEPTIIR